MTKINEATIQKLEAYIRQQKENNKTDQEIETEIRENYTEQEYNEALTAYRTGKYTDEEIDTDQPPRLGFFQKRTIKRILNAQKKALQKFQGEIDPTKQKEYRKDMIDGIMDLNEIFNIYIGENQQELLINTNQLKNYTYQELIQIIDEVTTQMEKTV